MKSSLYSALLIAFILLSSCGGTRRTLQTYQIDTNNKYIINSYYGCCGMHAYYVDVIDKGRKQEQIVYNFNDAQEFQPTFFVFNYSSKGQLKSFSKYIATTKKDFEIPVTELQTAILQKLDTISFGQVKDKQINYTDIQGFRKAMPGEKTHPFPLMKKGYKLPINNPLQ